MRKQRMTVILLFVVLIVLLSGCSYKEFEDTMRSKINNHDDEEEYVNPANLPDNAMEPEEKNTLFTTGETINYTNLENQTIQYTLNQVHVVDNINLLNLNVEDFANKEFILDGGTIQDNYQFVAVDVTIKNIDYVGYGIQEDDPTLFIEWSVGFKEGIEDPNGPWLFELSYFSDHPPLDKNQGQDYFQFSLPMGEELRTVVGWFLPTDQLEGDTLYYIIGAEGSPENYQYFELNFD